MGWVRGVARRRRLVSRLGPGVIGLAFAFFAHSALEKARVDRMTSLAFVARDGCLPQAVFESAAPRIPGGNIPKLSCLCLSRRSTRPALARLEDPAASIALVLSNQGASSARVPSGVLCGATLVERARGTPCRSRVKAGPRVPALDILPDSGDSGRRRGRNRHEVEAGSRA